MFRLCDPDSGRLGFRLRAGQYVDLKVDLDGRTHHRSYSNSSSAAETTLRSADVFVCGPTGLMDQMRTDLPKHGATPEPIMFEAFGAPPTDPSKGRDYALTFAPWAVQGRSKAGESVLDTADASASPLITHGEAAPAGVAAHNWSVGRLNISPAMR